MTNNKWQIISDKIDEVVRLHFTPDEPWMDGIIDPIKYDNAKYRILWILKEPYDENDDGRQDIRKKMTIKDFGRSQVTFKPMIYSSWGILNNFCLWDYMDDVENNPSMLDALKSTAFINVSKLQGETQSPPPRIAEYYEKNKQVLIKQINAFEPNIIIGGKTLEYFLQDMDVPLDTKKIRHEGSFPFYIKGHQLFIDAYHPGWCRSNTQQETYCDDIINTAKSFLL